MSHVLLLKNSTCSGSGQRNSLLTPLGLDERVPQHLQLSGRLNHLHPLKTGRGSNYKRWDKPDVNQSLRLIWTHQRSQQNNLRTEYVHQDFINLSEQLRYSAEYSLNPTNTQHSFFLCIISKATWRTKRAFTSESRGWWQLLGLSPVLAAILACSSRHNSLVKGNMLHIEFNTHTHAGTHTHTHRSSQVLWHRGCDSSSSNHHWVNYCKTRLFKQRT